MPATVAIIMRSKNEMPHVHAALEGLKQQTFQEFELFAVDSGSTDGTREALLEQDANLQQIAPDDYIPGKVLNDTIARTHHDIIVLLNADAIPQPDWLEKLILPILESRANATFSKQIPRPNARFIVAYDYERAYNPDQIAKPFFSAVACAFQRKLWDHHHFHETGYAEDALWATSCRVLDARIQLVPESKVEHSHNYSLKELLLKKRRHGRAFAAIHGPTTTLWHSLYHCGREMARDLLFACRQRAFRTIPYNIAYRATFHVGLYQGIKEGAQ